MKRTLIKINSIVIKLEKESLILEFYKLVDIPIVAIRVKQENFA